MFNHQNQKSVMERKVTFAELVGVVKGIKCCEFSTIETLTEKPYKKGCPISSVKKHSVGGYQLNYDYSSAVNNRLRKEGKTADFESEPLAWGTWVVFRKFITHKGKLYLRYYEVKGKYPKTELLINGRPATDAEKEILKTYAYAEKKASPSQGGLSESEKVHPYVVALENLKSIVIEGCKYLIEGGDYASAIEEALR